MIKLNVDESVLKRILVVKTFAESNIDSYENMYRQYLGLIAGPSMEERRRCWVPIEGGYIFSYTLEEQKRHIVFKHLSAHHKDKKKVPIEYISQIMKLFGFKKDIQDHDILMGDDNSIHIMEIH